MKTTMFSSIKVTLPPFFIDEKPAAKTFLEAIYIFLLAN
jgi:hypothetical protein